MDSALRLLSAFPGAGTCLCPCAVPPPCISFSFPSQVRQLAPLPEQLRETKEELESVRKALEKLRAQHAALSTEKIDVDRKLREVRAVIYAAAMGAGDGLCKASQSRDAGEQELHCSCVAASVAGKCASLAVSLSQRASPAPLRCDASCISLIHCASLPQPQVQQERDVFEGEVRGLQRDKQNLEDRLAEAQAQIADLQSDVQELEGQANALQDRFDELQRQHDALTAAHARLGADHEELLREHAMLQRVHQR